MSGVNLIVYEGRLGHSPEVKAVGDSKVAKFSLANSEKIKGEERTVWMDVEAWGKTAELVEKYVHKGDSLTVQGKVGSSTWEKDGQKKTRLFIRAERVFFGAKAKVKEESVPPVDPLPPDPVPDFDEDLPM